VFLDTYDNLPCGFQAVQHYTHEDQNLDRIKLRYFKRMSVLTKVQSISSFENFGGGYVGCSKITGDNASDANLANAEITF